MQSRNWTFFRHKTKLVTIISNRSPAFQTYHQYKLSPTSFTNIDAAFNISTCDDLYKRYLILFADFKLVCHGMCPILCQFFLKGHLRRS